MPGKSLKLILVGVLLVFSFDAQAAQIDVTTLADEDAANANCSLREALAAANTNAANKGCTAGLGADTIRFTVQGVIVLTSNLPNITESLSVIGPGLTKLTVDGDEQFAMFYFHFPTDDGNYLLKGISLIDGASPVGRAPAVHLLDAVNVVLEDAMISGMKRTAPGSGGAIDTQNAAITVRRTTFFNNSTMDGIGGAISLFITSLTVEESTFVGNHTNGATADGGAIAVANGSSATLRRSTFSGNTASDDGGAIAMFAANATVTIENSTFTGNSAAATGGAFMLNAGTATIKNTVLADNQISPPPGMGTPTSNISHTGSATLTSQGHNLIGDNTGAATAFPAGNPNINTDYVGTAAGSISPSLSTLEENGGPTRTHRVLAGSPLIDQGSCTIEPYDQRLYSNLVSGRIIDIPGVANSDDGCDIGAFERGALMPEPLFLDGFEIPNP